MVKGICLMVESLQSGLEHALVVSKRNLGCFSFPKHPLVKVSLTRRALTDLETAAVTTARGAVARVNEG